MLIIMNALVYILKIINKMHHSDAPLRELLKAGEKLSIPWKAVDLGRQMWDLIPMVPWGKYHGCLVK